MWRVTDSGKRNEHSDTSVPGINSHIKMANDNVTKLRSDGTLYNYNPNTNADYFHLSSPRRIANVSVATASP